MEQSARYTIRTGELKVPKVPMYVNNIIITGIPARYCLVVKADIPECDDLEAHHKCGFHSRDNRIKGDRRRPCCARLEAIPHLEKQGMLSRALNLATVTLLVGWFTAEAAHAQVTNLEAGKSPSQIFA